MARMRAPYGVKTRQLLRRVNKKRRQQHEKACKRRSKRRQNGINKRNEISIMIAVWRNQQAATMAMAGKRS